MKKYLFAVPALLAISGLAMLAADIDGTWSRTFEGRNGQQTQTLTLKSKGTVLTGTMEGGRGGATAISNGKISGTTVTFDVVQDFNGNKFTQSFKGTLKGKELTLEQQGGRGGGKGGGKGPENGGKGPQGGGKGPGGGKGRGPQVFTKVK